MQQTSRPLQAVAVALAALAGYVDAVAFLDVGGFFVSFMSGNSTRFGVGLAQQTSAAAIAGGLIGCFVVGVVCGSLVVQTTGRRRRPMVLALVMLLLIAAMMIRIVLVPTRPLVGAAFLAMAMGAANATFERDGEVAFGVTYMTGALVKTGQRIARALRGGPPLDWLPYLLLWSGLAGGAWSGALVYGRIGPSAILPAVIASIILCGTVFWLDRHELT
jgi:uncharacterized membrane protein YoaK (UPF0700 family)